MKKAKILSSILACALLCTLLPLTALAVSVPTITVVLLGNNGTVTVADEYSESIGLEWEPDLVDGNKVGTDTIEHIVEFPFDGTNLKAGYYVKANEGYYIDAFYRCQEDYENNASSLGNLDLGNESLYKYDENGYLTEGVITELTWPGETFYISIKEIPETSTLSLVVAGNNGTVTNDVGEYTTSTGIQWQPELTGGNLLGTDTLTLEHQAPWGETIDGMKTGYVVTAKEGYYIKALYPNQASYDAGEPFDEESYASVVEDADGYITSCQWTWFAEPGATAYFVFDKIPVKDLSIKDSTSGTGVLLAATTNELPKDTSLSVSVIKSGEAYNSVNYILGDSVSGIVAYDISLVSNNAAVQPNGMVKVYLPIPAGFDTTRLTVYYINTQDNTKTAYKVTVKTIDGVKYAVFETNHFSTYVLAEIALDDSPGTGDYSYLLWAASTLASAGAVIVLSAKRRKQSI